MLEGSLRAFRINGFGPIYGNPPMRRTLVCSMLGLVLVFAGLAPDGPRDPAVGKSYRVPYHVTDTNHFLVRVRINGKGPFNFLVDTGAPALFVGTEAAKAAGLKSADDEFWTGIKQFDFEGGAYLKDVKARVEDPFQLIGMNALGLPGASIDGILGFTMLARFKIELDPTKDRMVWTRLDYEPQEPFVPRGAVKRQGPADVQAMNLLGPLAKGMAAFIGKQPENIRIPRGRLGLILEETDGVLKVGSVVPGSPAAEAGVKPGDVLRWINVKTAKTYPSAFDAASTIKAGSKVEITVRRGNETLELTAKAGEGF